MTFSGGEEDQCNDGGAHATWFPSSGQERGRGKSFTLCIKKGHLVNYLLFQQVPQPQARNVSTNLFPTDENTRGEHLLQLANRKSIIKTSPAPASSANNTSSSLQAKPSLDEVPDDSLVAMTNKHGKGKYWFKSGCPTPDPRWPARQQLMIGPIPGDVEYATLR